MGLTCNEVCDRACLWRVNRCTDLDIRADRVLRLVSFARCSVDDGVIRHTNPTPCERWVGISMLTWSCHVNAALGGVKACSGTGDTRCPGHHVPPRVGDCPSDGMARMRSVIVHCGYGCVSGAPVIVETV